MIASDLYSKLKRLKVTVQLVDDRIDLQAPKNVLNKELLNEIRENKEALKALLVSYKRSNKKHIHIEQAGIQENYVLSSAQQRLWILSQFEESNAAYNIPGVYVFTGNLNLQTLSDAFKTLIERHEILRTVFKQNEQGETRQFILSPEASGFNLEYKDIRGKASEKDVLQNLIQSVFALPFHLDKGPLLRASVYQVKTNEFVFAYAMHHIISDGWSMGILIKELLHLYNGASSSNPIPLTPLRIQYKDYSNWQQAQLSGSSLEEHRSYWLKQFEGELPVFELLSGTVRPPVKTYSGGVVYKKISENTSHRIKKISQDQGATLFMSLLATVNILLYKYTGQDDIIIGSPIAGRDHADLQNQIGFYVNTLALRTRLKSEDSFTDILQQVKQITLDAYDHQVYPFDELVDALSLRRDMSRNPLFDVMVTLQQQESDQTNEQVLNDLVVSSYDGATAVISQFDLTFNFEDFGTGLSLALEFNTDIYPQYLAEQLAEHLVSLMDALIALPALEIQKLEYLSEAEKQNLLTTFNNTTVVYDTHKTIIDLFEEQAEKTPSAIALVFEESELTYKELNKISNQLARYLRKSYEIKANDFVGIELEKTEWAIISILAILKSGGAYVPIDPLYPEDRKRYMVNDSGCKLVINEKMLDQFRSEAKSYSFKNLNRINTPQDLAYVIYTSGTTGQPKGVLIEHSSVFDYTCTVVKTLKIKKSDRFIQQASFSFDTHVEEIFPILTKGGRILMSRNGGRDPQELQMLIEKKGATLLSATPLVLNELNNSKLNLTALRLIVSGGDVYSTSSVTNFLNKVDIYDSYGPSESTVCCTYHKIEHLHTAGIIGPPMVNRNMYILNDQQQLLPIAVTGEICIGGPGLARGYLNKPELTAEKFVVNPFKEGDRIYKTGDLGRWLPDGRIQFLGRKDDQVKIRGYRVELGEIENALKGYPETEAVAVTVTKQADGQSILAAYIVSARVLNSSDLQTYLNTRLPKYMIPSHFVQLEQLPINPNGKIDKRKLPAPDSFNIESGVEYIAARTETEEKLLTIWQAVLKKDKISMKDNFFDLGGHSISATRLAMQIHKLFNNKPALKDLFAFPVLEEQAAWIEQLITTNYSSIPLTAVASDYPLSTAQRRLWVLSQFEESNAAYNMPGVYVFTGDLNPNALKKAFTGLIERHEILRTVFKKNEQEEVRQFILSPEAIGFNVAYKDISTDPDQKEMLQELVREVVAFPFQLEQGPLLRASVYQVQANKFVFAYAMHHIISDGWSMGILIKELLHLYNGAFDEKTAPLTPLRIQYKDYGAWQQEQLSGEALKAHQSYWLKQFEGELPVLELAQGAIRPAIQTYQGNSVYKAISENTTHGIKKIIQEGGATLFMGLVAIVNTLLYRHSNQEDIIIGSPISGREHADLENQIGFYVNTLALRTRFKGEDNFKDMLRHVKQVTLDAYDHQVYPFDELVNALDLQRDMSRNPLFDVMVTLQHSEANQDHEQQLNNLQVSTYQDNTTIISKFDFTFNFEDSGTTLSLGLEYNTDIYPRTFVEQLAEHLMHLMDAVIEAPAMEIRKLNILSTAESEQLLVKFNDTQAPYPTDRTIIDLFEEQVAKTPDATALIYEEKELSYKELNEKANQFAHYLRTKEGVKAETLIGIKLERNDWMLVVLLGILKSGAAYLPIDMDYPAERIDYMLADSKCELLIDNIALQQFKEEQHALQSENPVPVNTAHHLAYVIYTSGSTGQPKGVMIEHSNAVAFISWCKKEFSNSKFDTVFAVTSICFDLSIFELIFTLCIGKKIRLLSNALAVIPYLATEENSLLNMVPSAVGALLNEQVDFSNVKVLNMAGEPIPEKYISAFDLTRIEIRNLYGPSEDTTYSSVYRIKEVDVPILIGHPIDNTQFYILNTALALQPIGVIGEIYISGKGLARGYMHKPALTREKFIENPFHAGERMYKTGDLGSWQADGNIAFMGRVDDQVKIRGYRIELGEIENMLQKHPAIEEACVIASKNSDGQKEVAAYFVTMQILTINELRSFLSASLPEYMIPSHWIKIDQLPLTPNGKVDKKKLPAPENQGLSSGVEYMAPRNETEQQLQVIWNELLKKDKISIHDNFFELGGNSLKAIQLISRLTKNFNVALSLRVLFTHPTIERLANEMGTKLMHKKYVQIDQIEEQENYVLSAAQRRLWILSQFEGSNTAYNMPGVYVFNGDLNIQALAAAFRALIERHEILRTVFKQNEQEEARQYILSPEALGFVLEYKDIRKEPNQKEVLEELVQSLFTRTFQLEHGPLLRASVFQVKSNEFVFAYAMHHIISDGWSMGILIKELLYLYNSMINATPILLPPLRIQYKDYGAWQQVQLSGESLSVHQSYWLKQFEGELPVLELAQGTIRPAIQTYRGGIVHKKISEQTSRGMKQISQEQGASLFMSLLAVVNILLYRHSNQEDIIIGSPIAGREHADLENQIGFYVNTLALRTRFKGEDSFIDMLHRAKQVTLDAYDHQVYPFDELVDALDLRRDMSRNPLFDVVVMLQQYELDQINEQPLENLQIKPYEGTTEVISKFDFTFNFEDNGTELSLGLEYNADIYTASFVEQLAAHLINLMDAVVERPASEIRRLQYLTAAEREQLLIAFNNTSVPYPNKTVIEAFEEQVEKTPEATALFFDNTQFSYKELNEKANQFAHYLTSTHAVQTEDRIAIKLERSDWMIVCILATLKSGAAYVPIDPSYPEDRIAYMLEDSRSRVLIDLSELERFKLRQTSFDIRNLQKSINSTNLVYVIYTSGSTGKPKGVMVEHGSLMNLCNWHVNNFELSAQDRASLYAGVGFDASAWEIFPTIISGACMYIVPEDIRLDVGAIATFYNMHKLTIGFLPTQIAEQFFEMENSSLRFLLVGGDKLNTIRKQRYQIINNYGPTENTVVATSFPLTRKFSNIPIGKPISNTEIYILDPLENLVPAGVTGEICIGGAGLARGYLNMPALTAEKFVTNPFKIKDRIYKTGDLGRWKEDGTIEFIGRMDDQVKIRGYRIELGEIVNALHQHPAIEMATVLIQKNSEGQKEIVAYFVANQTLHITELRNHLGAYLPSYMIPAHWLKIDHIPLTPNGKIDKKKLLAIETQHVSSNVEYMAPRNETEEKLLLIWKEVLGKNKISIKDDFFELGGNSLKVLKMHSLIRKTMQLPLKIQDIYHHPTIEMLAGKRIESAKLVKLERAQVQPAENIYFIPPVIGNSMLYKPIAQMLGKNFNSFGFQYSGLEEEEPLFESIEQAAAVFCEQLISNQNDDHLILVGYSMGGNIAFEMAKLLEATHFQVSIVLIDTITKTNKGEMSDAIDDENETDWLIQQYKLLIGEDEVQETLLKGLLTNNFRLFNKYEQTGKIKNQLYLFEAKGNPMPTAMNRWSNFTDGKTVHEFIEGGHWDALASINLQAYTKAIMQLSSEMVGETETVVEL